MNGGGGGVISNVRLVKCPKCSRVLPELTNVPVYRCGGCGVVLQAKNRKKKIEDSNPVPSESAIDQQEVLESTLANDKESGSPNQNHMPSIIDDNREQRTDTEFVGGNADDSKDQRTETEFVGGNTDDSKDQRTETEFVGGNTDDGKDQRTETEFVGGNTDDSEDQKTDSEFVGGNTGDSKDQRSDTTKFVQENVCDEYCVDNEVLATDNGNSGQSVKQDSVSDIKGQSKVEVHSASTREMFVGTSLTKVSSPPAKQASDEPIRCTVDSQSFDGSESEHLPFNSKNDLSVQCQPDEDTQGSQKVLFHGNGAIYETGGVGADELLIKRKRRPIVNTGNTHFANASPAVKEIYGERESVTERASTSSSPLSEELQSFGGKSSSPNEEDYAYGSCYSEVIQSLPIKKTERSPTNSPNVFDSVDRAHELEGITEAVPSSSELSGTHVKSAPFRSGYGYEGSISSYEDQYDQIYKHTFRDMNYVERNAERNFKANQVSDMVAMQQQAQEFFRSKNNHTTTQESSWNPRESDELMRHQIRNQMGMEAEIYPSEVPFATRTYENDSLASDGWYGIQSDSSVYSADKLPYTEKKRMELLKMVHELQEELIRSPTSQGNVDRRSISQFSNGRQMPAHKEFLNEANLPSKYSRYPHTRSEQGTNWPRQQSHLRMPFSGEVTNHRHHDEYYCQHRHPMDQRFSAQLAPSVCSDCSLNAGLQRVHLHPGEQFCNPYGSSTSSPPRHAESEFPSRIGNMTYEDRRLMESKFPPRVRGITYNDQRLMERRVEASLANSSIAEDYMLHDKMKAIPAWEKQLRVKRQIRPIAGGAPFIACYQCWSMLQLPADSFPFQRRHHKLKCGSCSNILKFSLEDRTHLVPHVQTSNVNTISHSDGISRSDHEIESSLGRSFSATQGKQEFLAARYHAAQVSIADGKKTSSGGLSDNLEGKKKRFSNLFLSKDKRPIESPESSSTNRTFNIENYSLESKASKPRTGSPLHKLMGYTSISQVFRGPSKGVGESFRNKSTR